MQNKTTYLQQGHTRLLTYTTLYTLFACVSNILGDLGKHINACEIAYKVQNKTTYVQQEPTLIVTHETFFALFAIS